jgi:four helix bundle protein
MNNFRTYQLALELAKDCVGIRLKGPHKNQFERALLSIALNLSEGSAKRSKKERRQFYERSLGSIRECQTIVEILQIEGLSQKLDRLAGSCYVLVRSLG